MSILVLVACQVDDNGNDPGAANSSTIPDSQGSADSTDGSERYQYTDETEPRVDLPTDSAALAELKPPLAQLGEDNGDNSLIYAATLGGYYFLRVQLADGSYNYQFDPDANAWTWEDVIHRQVGPGYAQVMMYNATGRQEFLISADWVFDYAAPRLQEQSDGSLMLHDIGGTSLFIMGLTHYSMASKTEKWVETYKKLGEYLLSDQTAEGDFSQGSPLAQGQILQALGHLYKATKDEKWLNAMELGLKYQWDNITEIDLEVLPYFAVYVNEVLADLYEIRPADWIADFAFYTADKNIDDQYTAEHTDKEHWIGGFYRSAKGTPSWSACLRLEAIADAYRMAELVNDADRMALYRERLLLGAKFQMLMQWRKGETDAFEDTKTIIGAYPMFAHKNLTRSDFSWHASAMLIKVATYLDVEDFPGNLGSK